MIQTKTVVNNMFWKFLERCGSQGISIIVSIVLARLLDPSVFGIMSIIYVFTSIMNVFIDSGMGVALIQKKDADDTDFSSVFYFNVLFSVALYFLMFVSAPYIARFYDMPELKPVLRVVCLQLVFSGLRDVQQAYVSKNLIFKQFFYATIGGTLTSGILGITMAFSGFGVWALAVQTVSNVAVSTLILWVIVRWRPKLIFSWTRLKQLLSYGWKLLTSSLINIVYENLRVIIIGKMYNPKDLAFYNQGAQLPYGIVNNINTTIDSVFLPTLSAEQDDKERMKQMMRRAIRVSTFIISPLMLGLAAVANTFVSFLLTDKWLPCVPYLQIFCVSFLFYPINTSNLNAIKALGRSDIILKLEIIKKTIGIVSIIITMWISPFAMACGMVICSLINQIINAWPNKRLLDYSYSEQLRDIVPNLTLALVMALAVFAVGKCFTGIPVFLSLVVQVLLGSGLYILLSIITHNSSFNYVMDIARSYINRKH